MGWKVLVVDQAKFPRNKVCAEYLSPAANPIFDRLGVTSAIEANLPSWLKGMLIVSHNGKSFMNEFESAPTPGQPPLRGLAMPRFLLDELLVKRAAEMGATVVENFRVDDLLFAEGQVIGVLGRHEGRSTRITSKLVIAADGLHSVIARKLKLVRELKWLRKVGFVSHYEGVHNLTDYGEMHLKPFGYVGVAPLGEGRVTVSFVTSLKEKETWGKMGGVEKYYEATVERFPQIAERLKANGGHRYGPVGTTGPLATATRRKIAPGVMLVGDAAAFLDPFTGEGVYMAMRSAEMAAAHANVALVCNDFSMETLRSYEKTWQAEFQPKFWVCSLIQIAIQRPWLMNYLSRQLLRKPELANIIAGVTGDYLSPYQMLSPNFVKKLMLPAL
jgi:flavin-dependent dehydrogenase